MERTGGGSQQPQQQPGTPVEGGASPARTLPVFDSVASYEKVHRIGEGTYGVVCKCRGWLAPNVCARGLLYARDSAQRRLQPPPPQLLMHASTHTHIHCRCGLPMHGAHAGRPSHATAASRMQTRRRTALPVRLLRSSACALTARAMASPSPPSASCGCWRPVSTRTSSPSRRWSGGRELHA